MTSVEPNAQPSKPDELKSYWYPDRAADIDEVNVGYKRWTTDTRVLYLSLIPLVCLFLYTTIQTEAFLTIYESVETAIRIQTSFSSNELLTMALALVALFITLIVIIATYLIKRARSVYLVQFTTYQPPDELKISHANFMLKSLKAGFFEQESLDFQEKLLLRTGLSEETYFPPGIMVEPPELTMSRAREEVEMVFTGCLDQMFKTTHVKPRDIDILVVNCSLFNPTPSIAEMIMHKYKLRSDVKFLNLSGMGCSAGVVSIEVAKDLLQVYRKSLALVFSTENITQNWYGGNKKSMLMSNTLFRMGGAAILLSNRWGDKSHAKYRLQHTVRVNKCSSDTAYNSIYQMEDENGCKGVALSRDLIKAAGDALKSNLTTLGPLILPLSEQIKFFVNLVQRKVEVFLKVEKKTPAYVPDFKKAVEHFCIHAGGRAIIDGIEENLKLEPHHVEPSRATLYRYGNTSSSSIWYELQYIERSGSIKRGQKVLQIGFGSGFQCNSAVWKRL